MLANLSFKRRRRSPPRAAWYLRLGRVLRRKRVAWARHDVVQQTRILARKRERLAHLAAVHDVPIDAMAAVPVVPLLPGQDWVEHRRAMGALKPAVVAEPPAVTA